MTESNGARSWMEIFRLITPILLFVLSGIASLTVAKLDGIDARLFTHLTNDDLHVPKSIVVTKGEFDIYQQFRGREMETLRSQVAELRQYQDKQLSVSTENNNLLRQLIKR